MNPLALIPLALQIVGAITGVSSDTGKGLIGLLGGDKAGDVAGAILDVAKKAFGTTDPNDIQRQIAADKNKADLALAQMAAETERFRIQIEDAQNARLRDVEVRKVSGGVNTRANVMLGGNFICIVSVACGLLFYRNSMPDGIAAILGGLIGSMATMLTQAFNFEFGSSRGSSEKTDQLAVLAAKR